jgi:hypothetical protein
MSQETEVLKDGGHSGEVGAGNGGHSGGTGGNSGGSGRGNNRSDEGSKGTNNGGRKNIEATSGEVGQPSNTTMETGKSNKPTRSEVSGGSQGSSKRSSGNSGSNSGNGDNGNTRTASGGNDQEKLSQKSTLVKPKDVKPSKAVGKSKTVSKKDSGDITDAETLAVILQSGFALLAGVTRRSHWNIDEEEALTIASPASTMIQKLTTAQKKKINQLTAPIVLGSAIASVVLPRLMIDLSMSKGVKTNARNQQQVSTVQQTAIPSNNSESGNSGETQRNANISKAANTTNDAEITDLFRSLDNGATAGSFGI